MLNRLPHRSGGAAGGHQQVGGFVALCPRPQQLAQRGRLVAEHRGQALAAPVDAVGAQPRGAVEGGLPRGQIGFAQQAAGGGREAGVEEPLGPARRGPAEHGRGQGVHAFDVGFGAQVLEVEPDRWFQAILAFIARLAGAGSYEFRRNLATEGLHPHIGARQAGQQIGGDGPRPRQHAHAGHRAFGGAGRHPGQGAGVVHPQAHLLPARRQFARQAPAHAQVAVVVHDLAEDVPKQRWSRHAAIVPLRGHAPGVWRRFVHSGA